MRELDSLREMIPDVRPPDLDSLRATARRRARRGRTVLAGAGLAIALVVGGTIAAVDLVQRTAPDPAGTPSPTPTSGPSPSATPPEQSPSPEPTHVSDTAMTAREVVRDDRAALQLTGVSMDDPDFRVSIWKAECSWCPKNFASLRPSFQAMAVTTDGFASASYGRPDYDTELPTRMESPGPGLLLIVDDANGHEWLIREDGSITRLSRIVQEQAPADPRGWFVCLASDDVYLTWCALDSAGNTAYEWGATWRATGTETQSAVSPGSGAEPWGRVYGETSALVAWWDVGGVRQRRQLAEADQRDILLNAPDDRPFYWSLDNDDKVLSLHRLVGPDQWSTTTRPVPFFPRYADVLATPGGGLVVRQVTDSGTRMWRSDGIDSGDWRPVYDSHPEPYAGDEGDGEERPFTVFEGQLWSGDLVSFDDGLTWNGPDSWR